MHLQPGDANKETRTTKLLLLFVIAQDMTNVLAKKTFNTFAELLHTIHIALIHFPFNVRARAERRNLPVDSVIPGDVSYQISDDRKAFHRLNSDRFFQR